MALNIIINKENKVPIYVQLKKQIMDSIKDGNLKVGNKMPTERELSESLKISRNTVSTAYGDLETEGVLKSYQGRGTFVAEEVKPWREQDLREKIIKFVDLAFEEALEKGMDAQQFIEIVNQRVKDKEDLMNKMRAVYIECNIEQAKSFSKQISETTNMNIVPLTLNDILNMDDETKIILDDAKVVITTFNHVNEVRTCIEGFNKEVLGVAINPDLGTIVKIARYPHNTKFSFICISEEFMFKIGRSLETAGLGSVNVIYSNSNNKDELSRLVDECDVIIVSPGRFKDIQDINISNKEIMEFKYNLDDGSVKALKSKIIELK